ncbi:MAG: BamA/TamA family outer membrane protein, partial [Saprospiraceae bacterium]
RLNTYAVLARLWRGFRQPTTGLLPALLLWTTVAAEGYTDGFAYVDTIVVKGNKRTKAEAIVRELELAPGDSLKIADIESVLHRNSLRLMNLRLFARAEIRIAHWYQDNCLELEVQLEETWYLYPIPVFELADRNFNIWWDEFNASFSRVNYGLDVTDMNFSGRGDPLKVTAIFGYSNRFVLSYRQPFLNRKGTLGLQTSFNYTRTHETPITTTGNRLLFFNDVERWSIRRLQADVTLEYRPRLLNTHFFGLAYQNLRVLDTVAAVNPDFFLNGGTRFRLGALNYRFEYDNRDVRRYALRGAFVRAEALLMGLLPGDSWRGLRLSAHGEKYLPFGGRWSGAMAMSAGVSIPRNKPPYLLNSALGYGQQFVRGYQYYVVDGLDFALVKTQVRYKILKTEINLDRLSPIKAFGRMPLRVFAAAHQDLGATHDPHYRVGNPLANRLLWGCGVGLDFVLYYDMLFRIEYSRNHMGEYGFFIQVSTGI